MRLVRSPAAARNISVDAIISQPEEWCSPHQNSSQPRSSSCCTKSRSRRNCSIGCSPSGWCGARKAPNFRRFINVSSCLVAVFCRVTGMLPARSFQRWCMRDGNAFSREAESGTPRVDATRILRGVAIMIGAGAARGAETNDLGELVASLDGERTALGVPSISVALVEEGRISLVQRGVKSASSGAPVGPQTRYQAASMSKTVAAITALSLSTEGRVSLDEDVAHYLKRWRLPELPPGSARPVTLRRLFGMTAGCNVPGFPGYLVGLPLPDDVQILQGGPPANTPGVIIERPPGTVRAYSGGGCQVGQVALEDATGQSF